MSTQVTVHYVFRPSDTLGHYDEALFVNDGPFPAVQFDNVRHPSNAVLENMPLVNEYDPDFVNVQPRPSGLVVAQVGYRIGLRQRNRR